MQLFEIETILSVSARDIPLAYTGAPLENVQVDLNSLKDKPFDTEGLQANHAAGLKHSVEDIEETLKKYR